jgi:hypothetical protein
MRFLQRLFAMLRRHVLRRPPEPQDGHGVFGWDGLVAVDSVFNITDKLDEAKYFLDLMRAESDLARFRWQTSACLNACRSAVDWLAWNVHHANVTPDGDHEPDQDAIALLAKYIETSARSGKRGLMVFASPVHPLLREMSQRRQETAHRSSLWIGRSPIEGCGGAREPGRGFVFVELAADAERDYFLNTVPGRRVLDFCSEVIALLDRIHGELLSG